jgi:voltage-gated potassium channel
MLIFIANFFAVRKFSPLVIWFSIMFIIMLVGIIGFMLIEGYRFLDALYMTVITITTIGYSEVNHMSDTGRVFNIFLIITSFSIFTYALANLTQFIASGEMALYFKNKKMMNALDHLNSHVIICGFGRNGKQAAETLRGHKVPFVVIDQRDEHIADYLKDNPSTLFIKGDATEDAVLKMAGILRAKSIICALPTDADNVFIVLSARALNQGLHIISRASAASAVAKMKKAGANHVIMPDRIGGTHMATLVSKPDVVEFIDYLSGEEGENINIESVDYEKLPPDIRDKTLKQIMEWKKTGVNCIGVKNKDGRFHINPPDDFVVTTGMKIIVLGSKEQIKHMVHNVG